MDVTIAALLPSFVNAIPGFTNIREASIAASSDFARDGAAKRVQTAYDGWVEKKLGKVIVSSSSSSSDDDSDDDDSDDEGTSSLLF